METNWQTSEKTFALTDGSAKLTLSWQSAFELPECGGAGLVAARMGVAGYEYAKAHATCPSCWSRVDAKPKGPAEGRSPIRKMRKVDLKGAVVVEADCADIADALLDREALEILELTGNVSIDEGNGLYMTCPACGRAFPVTMDGGDNDLVTIRTMEERVEIEDSFGRKISYYRNGGFDFWPDLENEGPDEQLIGMSTLKTAVLGISSEARHYLDTALGLGPGRPAIPDGIDLLDVAVRNRFRRSYGFRFHQDVKDVVMMVEPREGDNLHPGSELFKLPRDFDSGVVERILAANQWPDTMEVRKAVEGRLSIAAMLGCGGAGRVCGGDPSTVARMLGTPAVGIDLVYALHEGRLFWPGGTSDLFLIAAREEDTMKLVEALARMGPSAVGRSKREFGNLNLGRLGAYSAYLEARREQPFERILAEPGMLGNYEMGPAGVRIRYPNGARKLCGDYGEFRFSLASTTGFVDVMDRELEDGHLGGFSADAAFGECVIVLVASAVRYVAMVRVDPVGRYVASVSVRRGKRLRRGGKLDRAIGEWAEGNNLSREWERSSANGMN